MRAIRFRAWDGKKMYNWDNVDHPWIKEITGTPYPKLIYLPMSFLVMEEAFDLVGEQMEFITKSLIHG